MLLAAAVLTYLTGFVTIALALGTVSMLGIGGLLAVLRPVPGSVGLVALALAAHVVALGITVWQVLLHLPPTVGTVAALLVALLAVGAFGPTAYALAAALRSPGA